MSCLFCRIGRKEIPVEVVYEDDHTIAFLDIHPRAPGHTMVIPKGHSATLIELPELELKPLFAAVQRVAAMLERGLSAPGLTIGINQGRVSGQEIDHLHVHLLPRFEGDGGGSIQSVVEHPPDEDLAALRKKITG